MAKNTGYVNTDHGGDMPVNGVHAGPLRGGVDNGTFFGGIVLDTS